MGDRRLFQECQGKLAQYGCVMVSELTLTGSNHPTFRFQTPAGKQLRWVMPRSRGSDPRAEKNNIHQLERLLRKETQ